VLGAGDLLGGAEGIECDSHRIQHTPAGASTQIRMITLSFIRLIWRINVKKSY
jgi:hypothetical protein